MKFHIKLFIKKFSIAFLLLIVIFNSLWLIPNILFNKEFKAQVVLLPVLGFELLILFLLYYYDFKELLKWKDIEGQGKRADGKIINAYLEARHLRTEREYTELYLIIAYTDPDENKETTFTIVGNINPLKLASKECVVYKYKNGIYVTDFKMKKAFDKSTIWTEKEIYNYKKYGHLDENNYD